MREGKSPLLFQFANDYFWLSCPAEVAVKQEQYLSYECFHINSLTFILISIFNCKIELIRFIYFFYIF